MCAPYLRLTCRAPWWMGAGVLGGHRILRGLPTFRPGVVFILWALALVPSSALPGQYAASPSSGAAKQGPPATAPKIRPASALDLSDYENSVLLIHFWASWCKPCIEEMPSLIAFYEDDYQRLKERGKGVAIVLISNDLRLEDLERFMARWDSPFPVYFDPYGKWIDRFGLAGVPATAVLGPGGQVVKRSLGKRHWQDQALLRELKGYLQAGS